MKTETTMENHHKLHFIIIPLMSPGHIIPAVDLSRLIAQQGVKVTIITTPLNATLFDNTINRDIQSGLRIHLHRIPFPNAEANLPPGCENLSTLPSRDLGRNFVKAIRFMQQPIEDFIQQTKPPPCCLISDRYLPWTINISRKFQIPRLAFDGTSCFSFMCSYNIYKSKIHENVLSETESFIVPDLPDRFELTKAQLPGSLNPGQYSSSGLWEEIVSADQASYGLIFNTFEELESGYIEKFRQLVKEKVWCVGPVSLCNKDNIEKAERSSNKSAIEGDHYQKWLDSRPENSVVYVCLGTLSVVPIVQLIELGLALEESNRGFIWVIREAQTSDELEKFLNGFSERTKERGLVIKGWAPQVLILSHKATGGFLTHCGWNSCIEGVVAGLPMITWPLLAEQFYNEQFIVKVLRIGEGVGANVALKWGQEDEYGMMVKREAIVEAIDSVMDEEKGEEKRRRAREVGELANKALEEGGSSCINMKSMIHDILQLALDNNVV